jgi:two-component system, OmpR family, sensor histidine kinase TctE
VTLGKSAHHLANTFKLFSREQRSLFGDILDWMLTPLLLLWPVSLIMTYYVAEGVANKPFDRALESNVQVMSQFVTVQRMGPANSGPQGLRTQVNFPAPARELLRAGDADFVYYQVLGARGEFVVGEREFPLPAEDEKPELGVPKLRDDVLRGENLRVAYMWTQIGPGSARPVLIQVGETREKRATLAAEIIKGVMLPQFITLPLAVALVWFALSRGLRPLRKLEQQIHRRKPDDLSPIEVREVPIEVEPLVNSVNELLRRQKSSVDSQKRFLADAAHQLKTPLAGLRMQAELALRADHSTDELKHSLRQMARSSTRATHTVNQLLSLARAELSGESIKRQPVDLREITREATRQAVNRALDKGLDLGFDDPQLDAALPIVIADQEDLPALHGHPTLLTELVRNLIDNAIAYTPTGGVITARVLKMPNQTVQLQVEDTGPGISLANRELVFEPFFRVLGNEADGSGLGLAIVQEIARLHSAQVHIETAHPSRPIDSQGTRFLVSFTEVDV